VGISRRALFGQGALSMKPSANASSPSASGHANTGSFGWPNLEGIIATAAVGRF